MAIHGNTIDDSVDNTVLTSVTVDPALVDEVRTGLQKTPTRLSSRLFYDAEGSRIFQSIR